MHSRYTRILILCVLMLSLLASSGFAARRTSLAGNLLIRDRDDVFFMPQEIRNYVRYVTYDFGSSSSVGNGGIVFGNEQVTFGAYAHKTDFIGAIPNAFYRSGDFSILNSSGSNDFGGHLDPSSGFLAPLNWIDAIFGFGEDDMPWGVRISVGRAEDKDEPATGTLLDNNTTSFNGVIGATLNEIDESAEFSYATATNSSTPQGGPESMTEVSPFHFAVSARKTAMDSDDALQLGWLGSIAFLTGTITDTDATVSPAVITDTDVSEFRFQGGLGPVYMPHERTTVAMYGTVEVNTTSETLKGTGGASDVEDKTRQIVIPGWNIASEIELASWLQARAGLRSKFAYNRPEQTANDETDKQPSVSLDFNWYTGIGIQMDNFMLDGYFNPSVITTGTDLLGNASQLFGLVTASLAF